MVPPASSHAVPAALETGLLTEVVLPLALAVIMFGMGLGLRVDHFRLLRTMPRAVGAGLLGQLLLLPILAVLVAIVFRVVFDLSLDLAIGIVLLGALPGGATSNVLTYLAKGDTALSIVLTSITSLTCVLTTPLLFFASLRLLSEAGEFVTVSIVDVMGLTVAIIALPVILGMWVGTRRPGFAAAADRPFRLGGVVLLAVAIGAVIYENRAGFWDNVKLTMPAAATLNLLALAAGFLVARVFRLGPMQMRTATIEVGFQNGTFGIAIATTQLDSPVVALIPGFYSLFMFVSGAALAVWWARRPTRPAPARPLPMPGAEDAAP